MQMKREDEQRAGDEGDDVSGNAAGVAHGADDEDERAEREQGGLGRDGGCGFDEDFDAAGEVSGDGRRAEAEEVLDLGAGDEDGDAVGEADDDRARDVFDGEAEAGDTEQDEDHAGHEGADDEAVRTVAGEDAEDDDDECAGGAADLAARSAEGGDGEAGDDGGVEAGLGRRAGGDGEGHGERQGDEADGDAGDEVGGELARVVVAHGEDGFGEPVGADHVGDCLW